MMYGDVLRVYYTLYTHWYAYRCVCVIRIVIIISWFSWAGANTFGGGGFLKKISLLLKNFSVVFILIILLSIRTRARRSCVAIFISSRASSRHDGLNFFVYAMMNIQPTFIIYVKHNLLKWNISIYYFYTHTHMYTYVYNHIIYFCPKIVFKLAWVLN